MERDTPGARFHFAFLDGLRGLAALAVLIGHLKQTGGHAQQGNFGMAVDLFFILSGFVVMHAYGERLRAGMSFRSFARLRIIRLYPMLIIGAISGLALALSLTAATGEPGLAEVGVIGILGLLCLPMAGFGRSDAAFPLNPPQWSLFFEFGANFLFAAFGKHAGPRISWLIATAGAGTLVLSAVHYGYTDTGSKQADLWGGAARVAFGFFCGAGICSLGRLPPLGLFGGGLIVTAVTAALWPWWDAPVAVRLAAILVLLPAAIHAGASVALSGRALAACRFLGAISYPLYIIHTPLMGVTSRIIARIDPALTWQPWWIAGQALFFIGISWAFAKAYDEPVRAWLTTRSRASVRRADQTPDR